MSHDTYRKRFAEVFSFTNLSLHYGKKSIDFYPNGMGTKKVVIDVTPPSHIKGGPRSNGAG